MMIYLTRNGETLGPYSISHIKEMLAEQTIHSLDLAWIKGMKQWKPIEKIPRLSRALSEAETQKKAKLPAFLDAGNEVNITDSETAGGNRIWIRFFGGRSNVPQSEILIAVGVGIFLLLFYIFTKATLPSFFFVDGIARKQPESSSIPGQVLSMMSGVMFFFCLPSLFGASRLGKCFKTIMILAGCFILYNISDPLSHFPVSAKNPEFDDFLIAISPYVKFVGGIAVVGSTLMLFVQLSVFILQKYGKLRLIGVCCMVLGLVCGTFALYPYEDPYETSMQQLLTDQEMRTDDFSKPARDEERVKIQRWRDGLKERNAKQESKKMITLIVAGVLLVVGAILLK